MRIKRKDLEIFLEQLDKIQTPKLKFEQYATPARVAANLLWSAGIENGDIFEKTILDLGCGSGILSIGAAYLGAKEIVGIDIDFESLIIARKNSSKFDFNDMCHWVCLQAEECNIKGIDTVIMNPPFGMRKESISRDRFFVEKAFELSNTIYSIIPYAEETRDFFSKYCSRFNFEIVSIQKMDFEMKHLYDFHKRKQHIISIDLYHFKQK